MALTCPRRGTSSRARPRRKASQAGYGAFFAEVGVNRITGETRVRRMLGTFAAGRILNEKTARSQCQGGMIWGIGAALTEELASTRATATWSTTIWPNTTCR
jgi:CO/xanthine dehydrogenase Mo-binding subunit